MGSLITAASGKALGGAPAARVRGELLWALAPLERGGREAPAETDALLA